jgi:hypothetical protein
VLKDTHEGRLATDEQIEELCKKQRPCMRVIHANEA